MNQKDTFTLGGKEFSSRFILGSGKFSLDLVTCEYSGLYSGKCNTSSEYFRSKKCRGSSSYCKTFQRSWMW